MNTALAENAAPLPMLPVQALTRGFDFTSTAVAQVGPLATVPGLSGALAAAQGAQQHRQGFRIGDLHLMIRYEDGSELTEMPPIHLLPNAPQWFCGIANLHGVLISVFDLALYLGINREPRAKVMLLVLSHSADMHNTDAIGVIIDGLPQRLRWDAESTQRADALAPQQLAPHVRATCMIEEQLWFDLDCASLLDALEQGLTT